MMTAGRSGARRIGSTCRSPRRSVGPAGPRAGPDRNGRPLSRPHRSPQQLYRRTERRILGLRVSRRSGPARIAFRLRLSLSTVHKVLTRHQAPRRARATRPPAPVCAPGRRRDAPSATRRASWSTWTSRSSAGSPTVGQRASTRLRLTLITLHVASAGAADAAPDVLCFDEGLIAWDCSRAGVEPPHFGADEEPRSPPQIRPPQTRGLRSWSARRRGR